MFIHGEIKSRVSKDSLEGDDRIASIFSSIENVMERRKEHGMKEERISPRCEVYKLLSVDCKRIN